MLAERLTQRGDDAAMIAQRLASDEFERDLALPDALVGHADVVDNDDWQLARVQVDALLIDWSVQPVSGDHNVTAS